MTPRFLEACEEFQPAQKACWDILLRDLPDADQYTVPALDSAMERTLTQLWRMLREPSAESRLAAAQAVLPPLAEGQPCPLRAHLPYYNAGLRALELVAGEVERSHPECRDDTGPTETEELTAAFDLLVQCQLEALCSTCARAGHCQYSDRQFAAGRERTADARHSRGLPGAARPTRHSRSR